MPNWLTLCWTWPSLVYPMASIPLFIPTAGATTDGRDGYRKWTHAALIRSMSKKGCTPDNAACEGFFGRLKNEMFYNQTWVDITLEEFIDRVDEYIGWYNERRIKLTLDGLSPAEHRRALETAA